MGKKYVNYYNNEKYSILSLKYYLIKFHFSYKMCNKKIYTRITFILVSIHKNYYDAYK